MDKNINSSIRVEISKEKLWFKDKNNIGKAIVDNLGYVKIFTNEDFYRGWASHKSCATSPLSFWHPASKEEVLALLI